MPAAYRQTRFPPLWGCLTAMEDRSDRRVLPKGRIRIPDQTPGLKIVLCVDVGSERYALCERRLQISGLVFDITDAQDWRAGIFCSSAIQGSRPPPYQMR